MTAEFLILLFFKVYFWTLPSMILFIAATEKKYDFDERKRNAIKYGRSVGSNPYKLVLFIMSIYINFFL